MPGVASGPQRTWLQRLTCTISASAQKGTAGRAAPAYVLAPVGPGRGHLTQHGNPAQSRQRRQPALTAPRRELREQVEQPGLAAVYGRGQADTESRPIPPAVRKTGTDGLPTAGRLPQIPNGTVPQGWPVARKLSQVPIDVPVSVPTAPIREVPPPVETPAQGPPVKARTPRTLAWWERLLIIAVTMAFAVVIISFLFGIRLTGAHTHLALAGPTWVRSTRWNGAIFLAWLVPLGELILMIVGSIHYHMRFRRAPRGHFRLLLIQITTTGNEAVRVNEIIAQIRGYDLRIPLEIWVVTEPWGAVTTKDGYPGADRVMVVPATFTARSERKARALEFSRQVRGILGLDTADVKILFNDDDVTPTESYIKTAFAARYDVCEGITVPRVHYSTGPLAHFFASHADDTRTRGCLTYCAVFQGMLGKPLWVHGEGLTATGEAERKVTWDWPVIASEDLTFGQNAARMGLRWGWFHDYVEVTSPWGVKDFITQRRRWTWGNVHAIGHRDVLPLSRAIPLAAKYAFDVATVVLSLTGIALRLVGYLPPGSPIYELSKLSILCWLLMFFYCGWVAAEHKPTSDSRLLHAAIAALLSPVSSVLAFLVLVVTIVQGNPRTFEVIRKTRETTS
jgi:Glycosyl transferase family group 2